MAILKYEKLFSPISVRGCTFPNRIMSTAAVTRLATEDGHVTEGIRKRYKRMAKGGLGAMVVEAAVILPSKSSFNLRISDDRFVPELKQFVEDIRTVNPDVKIGLQLIHFLKIARSGWRQKVEDLKRNEIDVIPRHFGSAAQRAKSAGFDFVELHMAHFTTLASFLSLVNKRTDKYGGDFEGRVQLPSEVVLGVRRAVGGAYPIGVRINGEEFTKEGNTLSQSARIARRLAQLGVDFISVSAGERFEDAEPSPPDHPPFAGTGYSGSRMSPRWWHPDGPQVYLAQGVRMAVRGAGFDVPIVTAGKIRTPELAEEILKEDRADIIGMARALLSDPDWPIKAREGRADGIVRCAACGYCSEADERYDTITCVQWPDGAVNAPSPWRLVPPCKAACPAGLDVRGYIELITQGEYKKALSVIMQKIPLPATVGRVCPSPCETECNRGKLDEPVAINALKRFVADMAMSGQDRKHVSMAPRIGVAKVAVIGSGPAGLTAAFHLAKFGYRVTVFEALPIPGGMLTVGIPPYRLPRHVVEAEIDDIQKIGVEIRLDSCIGKDRLTIDSLWKQSYGAIFIATGAHKSLRLGVSGEDLDGFYPGAAFLKDVNLGRRVELGERVAIIGGGNVAIDAARTAVRLGSKEVRIFYRRSKQEMPAYKEEVVASEAEGIMINTLSVPCRIMGKNGKVVGLECARAELADSDRSGRRKSIPIRGSEFVVGVDTVISAIGEVPDLSFINRQDIDLTSNRTIRVNPHTMATNIDGIFGGGDVATGPATVIEAIAAGRKAALAIDAYLSGREMAYEEDTPRIIDIEKLDVAGIKKRKRQKMSVLSVTRRIRDFREIEKGFQELEALREGDRCLQCGMFPKK